MPVCLSPSTTDIPHVWIGERRTAYASTLLRLFWYLPKAGLRRSDGSVTSLGIGDRQRAQWGGLSCRSGEDGVVEAYFMHPSSPGTAATAYCRTLIRLLLK